MALLRKNGYGAKLAFVVLLLLFAAGLRIPGITYGQPDPAYFPSYARNQTLSPNSAFHPDEFHQVSKPLQMLLRRQLHPQFFENPNFLINLNFVTYWLTNAEDGLTLADRENIDGTDQDIGAREYAPFRLYVQTRYFSALGGLLAVAGAFALGKQLSGHPFGGAIAGLLTAVSLPMVQHAHYATTSSLAAGFAAVSAWAALATLRENQGQRGLLVLSGIMAGLAAGCRYNAAAVSLVLFFVGCVLLYRNPSRAMLRQVLLGWLLFPVSFVLTTPYLLRDPAMFLHDFQYISNQYVADGATGVSKWVGLFYEYRYLVVFGVGIPATVLGVLGVAIAFFRPRVSRQGNSTALPMLLLLGFIVPYSYVVLRTVRPNMAEQMLVPIIPVFAALSGLGAVQLRTWLPGPAQVRGGLIAAAIVAMPLVYTLPALQLFHTDTRDLMTAWITEHVPPGTTIHLNGSYNVALDPAYFPQTQNYYGSYPTPEELRASGVDLVLLSDALLYDDLLNPLITPSQKEFIRDYLALWDNLPVLARVERPVWPGSDQFMNSMRIWHSPTLTLYCLDEAACAAMR
ncbi:MAG: phospholipid carrier-dependent glycosyltransferase [Anaerolineae bacterium]|nr:phospholipid carrier-dependent glycosyltransferase [Anaerolineae bacterium]